MEQQSTPESDEDPGPSPRQMQIDDLHQRIETLEALDDALFGEFSRRDWSICIVGAVVIPTLVLVWIGL